MSALAIPDPRKHPVPADWLESVAAPAILATEKWSDLDEYEARLHGIASYIDAFDGDILEFEKALRLVEKRRGDLLGAELRQGARTDLQPVPQAVQVEVPRQTAYRWRTLAANWDNLWPIVRDAQTRGEISQIALLRRVSETVTPKKVHRSRRHGLLMDAAADIVRLGDKWERAMTDELTPPQARKQLTVLNKAAAQIAEVIAAVEYRADTLSTFNGR